VLRAIRRDLPGESLLYLGDTARLPYGTKSPRTVTRYAIQTTRRLVKKGIKLLVVACNTASAVALEAVREELDGLPVIGVVRPGAEAAAHASRSGRIAVLSTESTAAYGAYEREIRAIRPDARVLSRGCPLFVALAEEGWSSGPIVQAVAREYLAPILEEHDPDTIVLGCTHFPVLTPTIREVVGPNVAIVDSAATTARAVRAELDSRGLRGTERPEGTIRLFATDAPERFDRVAARFLPPDLIPREIELVDLLP
jgi:glutamate racemase